MISDARSRVVTTTTRPATSIRAWVGMFRNGTPGRLVGEAGRNVDGLTLKTKGGLAGRLSSWTNVVFLLKPTHGGEHRHVRREYNAADGDTEEGDHDRFEELHQAGD